ncbi:MAG: hypothetical protein D6808_03335 [Candidatus Dadabacteria bacterium]|nr:MAG: hypothetical protein D6808_03335 [Candidatus Dadabacteria bacterium]
MDIYRYFHPHHNPRLMSTPIRQLELVELEQAASELEKSLKRAKQRLERKSVPPIMPEHFTDVIKAMNFVTRSLQTLCDAHPGDSKEDLRDLVEERSACSGWETWSALLQEQLNEAASNGLHSHSDLRLPKKVINF